MSNRIEEATMQLYFAKEELKKTKGNDTHLYDSLHKLSDGFTECLKYAVEVYGKPASGDISITSVLDVDVIKPEMLQFPWYGELMLLAFAVRDLCDGYLYNTWKSVEMAGYIAALLDNMIKDLSSPSYVFAKRVQNYLNDTHPGVSFKDIKEFIPAVYFTMKELSDDEVKTAVIVALSAYK